MGFSVVGHCPKCGAPVYAESPWFGVVPPPSQSSCLCNFSAQPRVTTATNITINGEQIPDAPATTHGKTLPPPQSE
jgi:hypothetical protein